MKQQFFSTMISSSTLGTLLGVIFVISSIPNATSYTKYGRTCKDIGCRRDEVCVMAEDPCSIYQRDNCGRYPTCSKAHPGEANCASTVCGENEYCKTENGVPTCVKKSTAIGYDSAGVSYVNGQRSNTDDKTNSNSASNSNPYANANAPPAPADPAGGYRQVNSDRNLGYPAYPSNSGSNSGYPPYPSNSGSNNGYPPYPSNTGSNTGSNSGYPPYPSNTGSNSGYPPYPSNTGSNNGYPPYPSNNRMPMPGYPAQNYPGYPGVPQPYPGYPNYPQNRMNHNVYSTYRKNNGVVQSASLLTICLVSLLAIVAVYPTQRPWRVRPTPPTPPPRSSSNGYGGRISGNSGSRNTVGNGSIFNRLFGNDRIYGSRGATSPGSRYQPGGSGYYNTHTSVDNQGNRVWTFSG